MTILTLIQMKLFERMRATLTFDPLANMQNGLYIYREF